MVGWGASGMWRTAAAITRSLPFAAGAQLPGRCHVGAEVRGNAGRVGVRHLGCTLGVGLTSGFSE